MSKDLSQLVATARLSPDLARKVQELDEKNKQYYAVIEGLSARVDELLKSARAPDHSMNGDSVITKVTRIKKSIEALDLNNTPAVLYVDDENQNLNAFSLLLDNRFRILTAHTAEEALCLLETHLVAVLITDQRMPKMTGSELCDIVKCKYPNITRIIMTAYADLDTAISSINEGRVWRFIRKPYKESELVTMLNCAIDLFKGHSAKLAV